MKKSTFLKVALVAVAMLMFAGANAQINHTGDPANYVDATASDTYQTVNLGFRLYALPDVVYSPLYDGTGAAGNNLGGNSQWTWAYGAAWPGTVVKGPLGENWVDLTPATLPAAGASRNYMVLESNTAISCVGTEVAHLVYVIEEPSADIAGVGGAGWTTIGANDFRRCATGADIADDIDVTLTEAGAPAAAQEYTYGLTVTRWELDEMLVQVPASNTDVTGTYGVAATPAALVAGLAQTFTIPVALPLIPSTPTQYVFTLTANSIYSNISNNSHLRAGIANAGYTGAATTVTYTLLPVPTTGPIYHIPNNF